MKPKSTKISPVRPYSNTGHNGQDKGREGKAYASPPSLPCKPSLSEKSGKPSADKADIADNPRLKNCLWRMGRTSAARWNAFNKRRRP